MTEINDFTCYNNLKTYFDAFERMMTTKIGTKKYKDALSEERHSRNIIIRIAQQVEIYPALFSLLHRDIKIILYRVYHISTLPGLEELERPMLMLTIHKGFNTINWHEIINKKES